MFCTSAHMGRERGADTRLVTNTGAFLGHGQWPQVPVLMRYESHTVLYYGRDRAWYPRIRLCLGYFLRR